MHCEYCRPVDGRVPRERGILSRLRAAGCAIPEMFRKAFKLAETERPAAVYLAIPEHIDADDTDYDLAPPPRNVVRAEAPAPGQVHRAADVLA